MALGLGFGFGFGFGLGLGLGLGLGVGSGPRVRVSVSVSVSVSVVGCTANPSPNRDQVSGEFVGSPSCQWFRVSADGNAVAIDGATEMGRQVTVRPLITHPSGP